MKSILVIAVIMAVFVGISYTQCPISIKDAEAAAVETTSPETPEAIEVGNTICPVTGDEIDSETKVTYEYEGNIYNFCCEACVEEFKKDPEKYIEAMEEESEE